jgi:hypothetical protein
VLASAKRRDEQAVAAGTNGSGYQEYGGQPASRNASDGPESWTTGGM